MNPAEPKDFPLGRWNLYIGGASCTVRGYVNVDLFAVSGVDVAADAERLPFRPAIFQRVECHAVLEHVRNPARVSAKSIAYWRPAATLISLCRSVTHFTNTRKTIGGSLLTD